MYYTFAYSANEVWLTNMSMSCILHLRLSCKSLTWRYVNVLCTTPSPILQRRFALKICQRFDLKICNCLLHYTFAYPAKVRLKDMNVLCTTPSPMLQRKFDWKICQCLVYYTFAYPAKEVWLEDMTMSCVLYLRLSCKSLTQSYVNVLCTTPISLSLSLSPLHLSSCLSVYLSICLPVYLWCSVIECNVV